MEEQKTEDELLKEEAAVEAVLFAMGSPVELSALGAALELEKEAADAAARRLMQKLDGDSRGIKVIALEDSYQLVTRPEFYEHLIRVAKTPKKQVLTEIILETLSIVACRQPVTRNEINAIRGVNSDRAVNRLVEYGLIYESGRMDAPGRPSVFSTTDEFLRRFGMESIGDMPSLSSQEREALKTEVLRDMDADAENTEENEEL